VKRSPMKPRQSQMARGNNLGRSSLARGSGLRPVSTKRQRENRERRAMVAELFPQRPLCVVYELFQVSPDIIPPEVIGACGRWADDVHEPLTRARAGGISDKSNAVAPCRRCHEALGLEPAWGYQLDLIRHSWNTPKRGAA
jgi:hypothetical protein